LNHRREPITNPTHISPELGNRTQTTVVRGNALTAHATYASHSIDKMIVLIKYLRYNACSYCLKVCNMSVYIRGQRFSAHACTSHRFKIFYKSNIEWSLVSIYCVINTLEVVEHLRSQRNTWLCFLVPLNFSHGLKTPLYSTTAKTVFKLVKPQSLRKMNLISRML
jgi:hypothetical protein